MFEIVNHQIDVGAVVNRVISPRAGAVATFIGLTRNFTGDLSITSLFYEAYDAMAVSMMAQIGTEAQERFGIEKIAMTHRVGPVPVAENSVVIAVSAAHREAAFKACQFAIDTLKRTVPIWKKEMMTDGRSQWIANH